MPFVFLSVRESRPSDRIGWDNLTTVRDGAFDGEQFDGDKSSVIGGTEDALPLRSADHQSGAHSIVGNESRSRLQARALMVQSPTELCQLSASIRRIGAFALAFTLTACSSDQVSAPAQLKAAAAAPSASLLGGLTSTLTGVLNLTTSEAIQRTKPLPAPITVMQTIGYNGGTFSIPAAGVTVTVPRGALRQNTVITMTARAGSLVAYDFSPHGITFDKPLVFTQSLRGTNVTLLQVPFLRLGYYDDPSLLGQTTALVSELLGGVTNLLSWSFTAPITHFSGYVVLCGRE